MNYRSKGKQRHSNVLHRHGSVQLQNLRPAEISDEYDIVKPLGTGRFGKVFLAKHRHSESEIALKVFPKQTVKQADFVREYNYSYFLSAHQNIADTYEGAFVAHEQYYFVQEFTGRGSFRDLIEHSCRCLSESITKEIIEQVINAVEYMHEERLVHRNLKAENVLIFGSDPTRFDRVKITDFGLTRNEDSLLKHLDSIHHYHAPELCDTLQKETYTVDRSVDVWALGIMIFYALKGRFPWVQATIMCKTYWEWEEWLKRNNPQLPRTWTRFTERVLKLFRRTLHHKPKERCAVKDLRKYLKYRWLKETKSVSVEDFAEMNPYRTGTTKQPARSTRRSALHQWFATTLSTMSEISEQMVSAADDT